MGRSEVVKVEVVEGGVADGGVEKVVLQGDVVEMEVVVKVAKDVVEMEMVVKVVIVSKEVVDMEEGRGVR